MVRSSGDMTPSDTIIDVFNRQVQRLSAKPVMQVKKQGRYVHITYGEAGQRVRDLSLGLLRLGMKQGEHVTLLSRNRPEFVLADLAILSAGAITVPIYPTLTADEAAYIIHHSGARILIADQPDQLEKVRRVKDRLPNLEHLVLFDEADQASPDWVMSFDAVAERGRQADESVNQQHQQWQSHLTRDDVATIIYTSGTTGPPKGAMITHGNIMFVCESMQQAFSHLIRGDEVHLSYLPLAHALERMATLGEIFLGGTVGFAESLETVGENLREVAPTTIVGVPRVYEKIHAGIMAAVSQSSPRKQRLFHWALSVGRAMKEAERGRRPAGLWLKLQYALVRRLVFDRIKARFGGRARYCVSGAAPLSKEIAEFFDSLNLTILEGYGATETCGPATINRVENPRFGAVGPPLPGVEIKIAEDGEILLKGGNVFKGYFKDPEATRQALRDDWYYSGDVGRIDDAGRLIITDRKKDLIITSAGKNIAPQNLENFFKTCEYINQFVVIGDRRNYLTALVTLSPEAIVPFAQREGISYRDVSELAAHPQVRQLLERCLAEKNAKLAGFEQIKKFTVLDADFSIESGELTPTLKVKRKVVNEKYRDVIDAMYD
jgi:long-chain acyl-CoA synthetase